MKALQKYIYALVCTAAFGIAILLNLPNLEQAPLMRFYIKGIGSGDREISIYEAEEQSRYVFLPSYADMERLKVVLSSDHEVSLGGVDLENGMTCEDFLLETAYPLEVDGQHLAALTFCRSSGVAAMFIDTASGSLESIHANQEHEEAMSVAVYTSDGSLDYIGDSGRISGRGNATWQFEKKPYTLTLPDRAGLLGMESGSKWILLANAYDETNLRNRIVLDMAQQVGFSWTPDSGFVDVYLNGEYRGLYLLTEKVEAGSCRLSIDTAAGDFLCSIDLEERWDSLRNPFISENGRTVEISAPKTLSDAEFTRIQTLVDQMEQGLLFEADSESAANIDLDSWARRYLIDEISANIDSDLASSYFYYSQGRFYAGPVWDYDRAIGNSYRNQNPAAFVARNFKKSAKYSSPYYHALYASDAFRSRMIEIYRSEFLPVLHDMIDHGIENLSSRISSASQMNSLRWLNMYQYIYGQGLAQMPDTDSLIEYMDKRRAFLNSAWLEDKAYCTVQLEVVQDGAYLNTSVEKGSLLKTEAVDLENTVWYTADTREVFDFAQPITTDVILTRDYPKTAAPEAEAWTGADDGIATQDMITILSVALMAAILAVFLVVDIRRRTLERGRRGA